MGEDQGKNLSIAVIVAPTIQSQEMMFGVEDFTATDDGPWAPGLTPTGLCKKTRRPTTGTAPTNNSRSFA